MANPFAELLSFVDPQKNKQRLAAAGLYGPTGQQPLAHPPQQGQTQQQPAFTGYSMGTPDTANPASAPTQFPVGGNSPVKGSIEAANAPYSGGYNRDAASRIMRIYVEGGMDPMLAAGMAANVQIESEGNPKAWNASEKAFGINQLRDDRYENLKNFANERGTSIHDIDEQIKFSMHELNTHEKKAYDKIMGADPQSASDYASLIDKHYERSDGKSRSKRAALASVIYSDFYGADGKSTYTDSSNPTPGQSKYTTPAGNNLSYGPEISAQNPMSPANLGQSRLSMGMGAEDYQTLAAKYGDRVAMQILNSPNSNEARGNMTPDALVAFLTGVEEEAPKSIAEKQSDTLSASTSGLYGPSGLSMGEEVPAGTSGSSAGSGGAGAGGVTRPSGSAPAGEGTAQKEPESPEKLKAIDRLFNTLYGTEADSMTDDERTDRRRAVGLAMVEGLQMLSRGTPMDLQGIATQKMELQSARRASADLKRNAQGLSDMLVASGMPELAQLPFAGESGTNAAMQALVTNATKATTATDAPFDLPASVRATAAQTMADMGRGDLADQIMNMPPGKALEDLYGTILGVEPADAADAVLAPEKRQLLADQFRKHGNEFAAAAIENGADDKTISDLIVKQGGVAPTVQSAVGTAEGEAAVDTTVDQEAATRMADAYRAAGDERSARMVETAGSPTAAMEVVKNVQQQQIVADEQAAIKTRGNAVAELIPDDFEGAEELRAVARSATTSEDLNRVYDTLGERYKTDEQKLKELAEKDPTFLPFLLDMYQAKAGKDPKVAPSLKFNLEEMDAANTTFIATAGLRKAAKDNGAIIRQIAVNPEFTPGAIQGSLLVPAQSYITSILGDAGPEFVSNETLTGARVVEAMRNGMYVQLSAGLKGAISDVEGTRLLNQIAGIGDTRLQMLALANLHAKSAELQELEHNAMIEWADKAHKDGTLGDRKAMMDFIAEETKDFQIFDQVAEKDMDSWYDKANMGDVVMVVHPDGTSSYVALYQD